MTIDEQISVLQAAKAGKPIQGRHHNVNDIWGDVRAGFTQWNFYSTTYRVKPEPKDYWLVLNQKGQVIGVTYGVGGIAMLPKGVAPWDTTVVHVREVLSDESGQ